MAPTQTLLIGHIVKVTKKTVFELFFIHRNNFSHFYGWIAQVNDNWITVAFYTWFYSCYSSCLLDVIKTQV